MHVNISVVANFQVVVNVERFSEVVELVYRVEGNERAQTFVAPAAISFAALQADVQIFLSNRLVGNEVNFIVAGAFAARRNNF